MFKDKVIVTIDVDGRRIFARIYSEPEAFDAVEKASYRISEWSLGDAVDRVTISLTALHAAKERC